MQRRVNFPRLRALSPALALLITPCMPSVCSAQTVPTAPSAAQPQSPDSLPQLLLVTRHDPKAKPQEEAERAALQDAMLGILRSSHRYQVIVYSPTQPLIVRALREHQISAVNTIEPVQPEGMCRVAAALGAQTVLFLAPVIDKTGLRMETELHQNVGPNSWQMLFSDRVVTDAQYGKRRLNVKEIIAMSVDAIALRLVIPSHLAADLNLKEHPLPSQTGALKPDKVKADKKGIASKAATNAPPAVPLESVQPTAPVVADPIAPATPAVKTGRTVTPKKIATAPTRKANLPVVKTSKAGKRAVQAVAVAPPDSVAESSTPSPTALHPLSAGPSSLTATHQNYEVLADHYHDNKDLANTITLLRYAVNERPHDIPLRRKLIGAYQERKMQEAALAEIIRAIQIAPGDGSLYRAYGDSLMAKGDVPGAEKYFRDAVRINADDILARISLGDALMLENQYAEAMETYQSAQKTDPHSPLPHRRLARVLLLHASADTAQYSASLEEVARARELTPKNDSSGYQEDYGTLMQVVESRLRELLDELMGSSIALTQGKQSGNDTLRTLQDIQSRADAISAYLDKLPAAVGQDATQVRYQQGAALLLQSATLFRSYVNKKDANTERAMQDAQTEARQELEIAHKRLADIRAAQLTK